MTEQYGRSPAIDAMSAFKENNERLVREGKQPIVGLLGEINWREMVRVATIVLPSKKNNGT